jgi:hypothetical protein
MNETQPISGAQAAALILALVPAVARVETYPQWSDATGPAVRRQRVILHDADGRIIGADRAAHTAALRSLRRMDGGDWDRPQSFDVASGVLSLAMPVVVSLPEALADLPRSPWLSPDEAYTAGRTVAVAAPVSALPAAPEMPGGAW